jgi:hypothetical protein
LSKTIPSNGNEKKKNEEPTFKDVTKKIGFKRKNNELSPMPEEKAIAKPEKKIKKN